MTRKSKTVSKRMAIPSKKSKPLDHSTNPKHLDKADPDRKIHAKPSAIKVKRIRIADVTVPEGWRHIDEKKLKRLVDSIRISGIRNPIHVRIHDGIIELVAGRHRLEAAKELGWTHIDAILMRDHRLDRQLWHYAENLDRVDLTALEHAEAMAKRAKLVAKKAKRDAHPGGRQPNDKGISKTAKVLGTSRDDVRRSKEIASISSDAKEAAIEAGLANNEMALLKVAKVPRTADQVRKVHELANPKRASKPDLSVQERKKFKHLRRTFAAAAKFRQAWTRAPKIVRDRFIARISKLAPTG
jgi:ParB family transcriptional regulator, chromosome partitioning protein